MGILPMHPAVHPHHAPVMDMCGLLGMCVRQLGISNQHAE